MFFPRMASIGAALLAFAGPAAAQIDYRNLDDDRPTLVEDAYPIERYAFELITPYSMTLHRGGRVTHATVIELAYGLAMGLHAGFKVPVAGIETAAGRAWGLAGARAFALYNFNTESPGLPAISLRADGFFPVGAFGGDGTRAELKVLATRSFGRQRIHLNGAIGLGPDGPPAPVEGAARWWYGAALDRVFFRQSLLLIGEVYARRDSRAEPVEVNTTLGARWQWTPTLVLDFGVSRRLRATGPDLALTFGISRSFAIAALMPSGPRPPSAPAGGSDAHRH